VRLDPQGLKVVENVSRPTMLAELDVEALFLFEMGLELSIVKLRALDKDVFGLGLLQFLATSMLLC
jgi:Kef-type K+ transport system membrane component KefB